MAVRGIGVHVYTLAVDLTEACICVCVCVCVCVCLLQSEDHISWPTKWGHFDESSFIYLVVSEELRNHYVVNEAPHKYSTEVCVCVCVCEGVCYGDPSLSCQSTHTHTHTHTHTFSPWGCSSPRWRPVKDQTELLCKKLLCILSTNILSVIYCLHSQFFQNKKSPCAAGNLVFCSINPVLSLSV